MRAVLSRSVVATSSSSSSSSRATTTKVASSSSKTLESGARKPSSLFFLRRGSFGMATKAEQRNRRKHHRAMAPATASSENAFNESSDGGTNEFKCKLTTSIISSTVSECISEIQFVAGKSNGCLLYTSPSPRD